MSLQSHRKFLIDEISRMSNIQVHREFLRKFTIPTLAKMLEEIRDKIREHKGIENISKEFEDIKTKYETGKFVLVGKHHHLDSEFQLINNPQWANIIGYFFVEEFELINKDDEDKIKPYLKKENWFEDTLKNMQQKSQ